jgi:hypothetical protein
LDAGCGPVAAGNPGRKEVGKLIKLSKAQQSVLSDDNEDEDTGA